LILTRRVARRSTPGHADRYRGHVTSAEESGTWHYGLIARYWAEFNEPEPAELAYYRAAIERFGQPALDLACGTGRLLLPLLAAGLDVDGTDISADMLALCQERADREGLAPRLVAQAMQELDLPRRYRTIYICGGFGIGGRRDNDLETLRRIRRHLEPDGALVFTVQLPFDDKDEASWARWLPGHRGDIPSDWPETADRRRAGNGDEFELVARLAELDVLGQRHILEMRSRLFRDGEMVAEEFGRLGESLYFIPELRLMLDVAGFDDVSVEGPYNGLPATSDDGTVVVVARVAAPGA
jgi:SAM-dependent methyltransferase